MNKKHLKWIIPVLFLVITGLFFYKAFLGYSMQGTDTSLGIIQKATAQVNHVVTYWMDDFLMGMKLNLFSVNIFTFILTFVKPEMVQFVCYAVTIFLSLLFSFLFLRKLKLSVFPAVFGAVAFAFTPHFITLSTAAHMTVIEMIVYPPMVFYFLTILFDPEEKDNFKKWLSLALAGIAWGILMTDDVQRGIYFSIPTAVYLVILIFRKNGINVKNLLKKLADKGFLLDIGKAALVLLFLLLSFFNGFKGWTRMLQTRSDVTQSAQQAVADTAKWNNATSWSFHPLELIDSFAFGYHGNFSGDAKAPYWGSFLYAGSSESLGFFVILFSLIGIFAFYKKNFTVKFFFWTGLVALLLSFGRFLPGTPFFWLFYKLPMMGNFRIPAKFIAVTAFAASILAAFGFEFIFNLVRREIEENRSKVLDNISKLIAVFLGLGIIWVLFCLVAWNDIAFGIGQQIGNQDAGQKAVVNMVLALVRMIIYTGLTLAIFLVIGKFRDKKWTVPFAGTAFIALLIVELWGIDWFYMDKAYFKLEERYQPDATIQFLKNDYRTEIFRVSTSVFNNNVQLMPTIDGGLRSAYLVSYFPYYKVQSLDYSSASSTIVEYNNFFMALLQAAYTNVPGFNIIDLNTRIYQMANVKYLLIQQPVSNTNLVLTNITQSYSGRDIYVYYVRNYLPRIGFYQNAVSVNNNNDSLRILADRSFPFNRSMVVNGPVSGATNDPVAVVPLQIVSYEPWKVTARVDTSSDGWVMFNAKYEPEWSAYIDGRKTMVYQANYIQMGVPVGRGTHNLEFRFEPETLSFLVSLLTLLGGIAAAAVFGLTRLWKYFQAKK